MEKNEVNDLIDKASKIAYKAGFLDAIGVLEKATETAKEMAGKYE